MVKEDFLEHAQARMAGEGGRAAGLGIGDLPLTLADLERSIRAADPTVRLVHGRLLRRVIREYCGLPAFRMRVPHAACFVIARQSLLDIVEPAELGAESGERLPHDVVLLERPSHEELIEEPERVLLRCWQRMFHARLHQVLEQRLAADANSAADIHNLIDNVGRAEFDEIRTVLGQEHLLLPAADETSVYVEFAVTYLEFRYFAPGLIASYFPGLLDRRRVDDLLARQIDADTLLKATRPAGTPNLHDQAAARMTTAVVFDDSDELFAVDPAVAQDLTGPANSTRNHRTEYKASHPELMRQPSERKYMRWRRRAERSAAVGNVVGAAICYARAEAKTPQGHSSETLAGIRRNVEQLLVRLQAALKISSGESHGLRSPLVALVKETPRGIWTVEARLLYDLQKVCLDHERGIWAVDVVEWLLSLGKRPIKRPLPSQREVLMSKHLYRSARRLAAARLPDAQRQRLAAFLKVATQRAEERLRDHFRPLIDTTFDEVGLRPQNLPEGVARSKLVEELLDRIVDRGFLTLGDLRDATSRNNLKLPDFARPVPYIAERLLPLLDLKLKRRGTTGPSPASGIVDADDGTGRRTAHGTQDDASPQFLIPTPPSITLRFAWQWFVFAVLLMLRATRAFFSWMLHSDPLLRADRRLAVVLDGVYQRGEFYLRWMQRFSSAAFSTKIGRFLTRYLAVPFGGALLFLAGTDEVIELISGYDADLNTWPTLITLGTFLVALIHIERFRDGVWRAAQLLGRGARLVFIDSLRWLYNLRLIHQIFGSRPVSLVFRFVVKPAAPTLLVWKFLPITQDGRQESLAVLVAFFLGFSLAVNSRLGRAVEEAVLDWAVESWHRFGLRILTGLFYMIMDLFRGILRNIERLLYTVDEWQRFRSGESRLSLVIKGGLGVVWFLVTYVVRFAVNLLIEPQLNPIKHFPVVTVSHKLLLPFIPSFAGLLSVTMEKGPAYTLATTVIAGIPGIFGFLVWELKENWRLYAANRPKDLRPVPVGHHGETMVRLLKPGFHSGTLPKRFAKLRRAEWAALDTRNYKTVRKHERKLQQVEQAVYRYAERELIELLAECPRWQHPLPSVAKVRCSVNRIIIALRLGQLPEQDLTITFEARSGWILADVAPADWAHRLPAGDRRVLEAAILGLYKTAGVDMVRSQVQAALPSGERSDAVPDGIAVWHGSGDHAKTFWNLRDGNGQPAPQSPDAEDRVVPLGKPQRVFGETSITWDEWVATWEGGIYQG